MGWYFGDVRVYVQGFDVSGEQIIARLQPLNSSTILHKFGYEDQKLGLKGLVATTSGKDTIMSYRTTGLSYTLSGPEGNEGLWIVRGAKASRTDSVNICLLDRPGLDPITPIYNVDLDLYEDDGT